MTDSILRSYQSYSYTSIVPFAVAVVVTPPLASDLLDGETDGFAIDATTYDEATAASYVGGPVGGTVAVINTGDPTDDLDDVPLDASNLVNTGTSAKIVQFPDAPVARWSPHNLLLQSQTFGTTWTQTVATITSNSSVAPDGTTTADTLVNSVGGDSRVEQDVTTESGQVYTLSCYCKQGVEDWCAIYFATAGAGLAGSYFDLANGVSGTSFSSGGLTLITKSITTVGSGWYRVSVTAATNNTTTNCRIQIAEADNDGTSGASDTILIWGAQLVRGYNANPYLVTTSAVRIGNAQTYDAAESKYAVWVEPSATNLCLYSDDFTNAAWTKSNMSAAKTATGPDDGANSASTLTATSANGTALQSITSASAVRLTGMWVKRRTGSGNIDLTQDNGSTWQTMTVTSAWTRVNLTPATVTNPIVGIRIVTSGDAVDVWGFQHELGNPNSPTTTAHTSTIPTLGVSVARAADVVRAATSTFNLSTTQISLYVQWKTLESANTGVAVMGICSNTDIVEFYNGGYLYVDDNGASRADITGAQGAVLVVNKAAGRAADNDYQKATNGILGTADTAGIVGTSYTAICLAHDIEYAPVGQRSLLIYQTIHLPRLYSDAELQAVST